jgi:hypothetical protein
MVTRRNLTFGLAAYGVAVVVFFCFFLLLRSSELPQWVEWVSLPGILIAGFGLVGVHSSLFVAASIIVNIGIYFGLPCLLVTRLDSFRNASR